MANILNRDKQIMAISALAEGSSVRSIERMTGVHRDTIMRLGVRVGQGCRRILDGVMRNLSCDYLQLDEIWGFVGKKQKNVQPNETGVGDVWTFCAIDAQSKAIPCFRVGKRDAETAQAFVCDLSSRLANRVQISTDALSAYVEAIEQGFGPNVDYAQIVKTYSSEKPLPASTRYSPPHIVRVSKAVASPGLLISLSMLIIILYAHYVSSIKMRIFFKIFLNRSVEGRYHTLGIFCIIVKIGNH